MTKRIKSKIFNLTTVKSLPKIGYRTTANIDYLWQELISKNARKPQYKKLRYYR